MAELFFTRNFIPTMPGIAKNALRSSIVRRMVTVIANCFSIDERETGTGVAWPFFENIWDQQFASIANELFFLDLC